MKKLFTLLLLGGLLFVGAGNVWGTTYKVFHNNILNGGDGTGDWVNSYTMIDATDGYKVMFFPNVAANKLVVFTIKGDDNIWAAGSGWIDNSKTSGTTMYLHGSDRLNFTTPNYTSSIFIYFKEYTCYVVAVAATNRTVNLSWNTSLKCHLYDQYANIYNGAWGEEPSTTSFSGNIPDGVNLKAIFHTNEKRAYPIDFGTITSNLTKNLEFNSSDLSYSSMIGTFNGTKNDYVFVNNQVIVPLTSSTAYEMKYGHYYNNGTDQAMELGANDDGATITNSGEFIQKNGNVYARGLNSGSAGDYLFVYKSWEGNFVYLDVYYPGDTYVRTVTNGYWGTICLPYDVASPTGATFYSIVDKRVDGSGNPYSIIVESVSSLEAGVPYLYEATSSQISATYGTSAATVGSDNGLIGTYVSTTVGDGYYVVYTPSSGENAGQSGLYKVNGATVTCGANKAYIDWEEISTRTLSAPGRRLEIPMIENTTTDIYAIKTGENAMKFFENGQFYILRNGVTYDATGRIVK